MRFSRRLYWYWVIIFLIFYVGILTVVSLFWGLGAKLWQISLVFILVGMIPPALITAFFIRRLDYMESDSIDPPSFPGQQKAVFHFKGRSLKPFDEVMQRIDRQWIISYSDRYNKVLKFRTDARMTSWGLGGYLKMGDDGQITVIVYPVRSYSKRDELSVNQTLRLIHSILSL